MDDQVILFVFRFPETELNVRQFAAPSHIEWVDSTVPTVFVPYFLRSLPVFCAYRMRLSMSADISCGSYPAGGVNVPLA